MENVQKLPNYDEKDLDYPVLMIGGDYFLVLKDAASLTKCSITAFKKSVYQKAIFIDSSGAQFLVSSAEMKGYSSPFFGFRFMTGRQITVTLRLIRTRALSLAEVIDVVRHSISRANCGADPESLSMTAKSAKTIRELFQGLNK